MCRNIRTLFNFEPPVNEAEIRAASLQFVKKISGFNTPSKANGAVFQSAVDEIARTSGAISGFAPIHGSAEESARGSC